MTVGSRGLFALKDGAWSRKSGFGGLPDRPPGPMVHDREGRLWLGYPGNLIAVLDGDRVERIDTAQGLGLDDTIWLGELDGQMMAAGTNGVSTWDGKRFHPLIGRDDQRFAPTLTMVMGPDDAIWLNSGTGIYRIALDELRRSRRDPEHRVEFRLFDHQDGLLTPVSDLYPLQRAALATDGRLWFSSPSGLYHIDPKRLTRNTTPPSVAVGPVVADGERHALAAALALPAGTKRVDLNYTAYSLSIPERVRFRYRLEGSDTQWQEAGARREAHYMNLAPGDYRFRVIAANEDGVWNEQGASVAFSIPPLWHQTAWFKAASVAALAALLWLLHRLRMKRQAARLMAQHEVRLGERVRIARDLHDTLLQSNQGLILTLQGLAHRLPENSDARGKLESALMQADAVLSEGRDRVAGLRAVEQHDLGAQLADVRHRLPGSQGPELNVSETGRKRALHAHVVDEVLAIGREAVLNALRHAGANRIEAQIDYGADELRLRIADDGSGIDMQSLSGGVRPGHWGLAGMQERASRLRARLVIDRMPRGGTEVLLRVPAGIAYPAQA